MRRFVEKGYDEGSYAKTYKRSASSLDSFEKELINQLIERIPKKSRILDLGCGVGVPYDKYLAGKGHDVVGIDISSKHVAIAQNNVRNAAFVHGDFSKFRFNKKFDAIVSFYAVFHIPRAEHKKLFKKMHSDLNKNGLILVTLGADDMKLEVNKFIGSKMAWSSYGIEKNKKLLIESGFKILLAAEDCRTEHHLWILAERV